MNAALGAGDGAIADDNTIGDPHLARQDHPLADVGAAGDAHLGGEGTATAGGDAMANVAVHATRGKG